MGPGLHWGTRSSSAPTSTKRLGALLQNHPSPFNQPEPDRIAVKVINHYGDEVLKVFEV